jgi:hypothetical protein
MTNTQSANHADRISAMHAWARASQIQRRGNRAITERWATPLRVVLVVIERDADGNVLDITNFTTLEQ